MRRPPVFLPVFEACDEFAGKRIERRSQYLAPRDNHIVVSGLHCNYAVETHGLFQPATHAVSFHRVSMFLGNGKSDARLSLGVLAIQRLDQEEISPALLALPNSKKLRPAFQPPGSLVWSIILHSPAIWYRALPALGRKTLAATGAAGNDDLAAALRRHARTEAVATLADKLGWLVGTLHLFKHRGVRPFLGLPCSKERDVARRCQPAKAGSRFRTCALIGAKAAGVNYQRQKSRIAAISGQIRPLPRSQDQLSGAYRGA